MAVSPLFANKEINSWGGRPLISRLFIILTLALCLPAIADKRPIKLKGRFDCRAALIQHSQSLHDLKPIVFKGDDGLVAIYLEAIKESWNGVYQKKKVKRILSKLMDQKPLKPRQIRRIKRIKRVGTQLRDLTYLVHPENPTQNFSATIKRFGQLKDLLRLNELDDAAELAKTLKKHLAEYPPRYNISDLDGSLPITQGIRRSKKAIFAILDLLRTTGYHLHDLRKELRALLLYGELLTHQDTPPQTFGWLFTLQALKKDLGDINRAFVKKKIKGDFTYKETEVKIPSKIKEALSALLEKIEVID